MCVFDELEASNKEEALEKAINEIIISVKAENDKSIAISDFEYEFVTSPRQGNIGSWYDYPPYIKKQVE